jgi:DNA-nicking Smr family endonuclease
MTRDLPGHRPRRRAVTPDEARIWRSVVRDVAPLPGRSAAAAAEPPPPDLPSPSVPPPPPPPPVPRTAPVQPAGLPALQHGRSPGVDKRTAERLKRGEMVIDAVLDLHGLTQDTAHAQLLGFVGRAYESGRRCLLVITGKGQGGGGVLRGQVPRWLNQAGLRERILSFSFARPQHGGEGALYVLVRRRR